MSRNSFNTRRELRIADKKYHIFDLSRLAKEYDIEHLPFCLKVLLENLLRNEDGKQITAESIQALCQWSPKKTPEDQIAFTPARIILQDFTGVPAIVDLAAMRDAAVELGGDPDSINPIEPVDLVIDHSVIVDFFGDESALAKNTEKEFERNAERYQFLRWGQKAFSNFQVVPPGAGIVHQVNLEYLAKVVQTKTVGDSVFAFPDTLVGTDSHTTMINGLGVLGWGVGGIEAEAGMLGQSITMLIPQVVGFELQGTPREGVTATDLVLTITEQLRKKGVVGKIVEFYGDGLASLPLADRATIANMAPEYGATSGIFPIDEETLRYLRLSGRDESQIALVETYSKAQGLWRDQEKDQASYSDTISLDLSHIEPSLAGPKRPQDRISLSKVKASFDSHLDTIKAHLEESEIDRFASEGGHTAIDSEKSEDKPTHETPNLNPSLQHGSVVIAAITSCTNTSNPAVMIAAGLIAQKARLRGLKAKPWVKTSLAPGSQVVPAYLENAELLAPLKELGFNLVGFGCTTCIGNSGPLPKDVSDEINQKKLVACSVLSGNRNFEGRIHQEVRANYLASPPLVVAYALAGTVRINFESEPIAYDVNDAPVFLKELWPSLKEINELIETTVSAELYQSQYASIYAGTDAWKNLSIPEGKRYQWPDSSYVKKPPFFDGITKNVPPIRQISNAQCLVKLGDSVTTDHISPAGSIAPDSPAGQYLKSLGISPENFNSYGSRRGNHEVMLRGTFGNIRLRNQLAPNSEGGVTTFYPSGERMSIFEASQKYQQQGTPLIVIAGKEYGTGSSRDWAAKGVKLLGVLAVIAESFERIHRSNLVGFGVLPLEFQDQQTAEEIGLTGEETFTFSDLSDQPSQLSVTATHPSGNTLSFNVKVRIDTPVEWEYFRHGGILHYVLRQLTNKQDG